MWQRDSITDTLNACTLLMCSCNVLFWVFSPYNNKSRYQITIRVLPASSFFCPRWKEMYAAHHRYCREYLLWFKIPRVSCPLLNVCRSATQRKRKVGADKKGMHAQTHYAKSCCCNLLQIIINHRYKYVLSIQDEIKLILIFVLL